MANNSKPNVLSIYYQNIRGLRTKTDDFYTSVQNSEYDIISLTETWLEDSIYDSELFGSEYKVFRADRDQAATGKSRGGGVLSAIMGNCKASGISTESPLTNLDISCVKLMSDVKSFLLITLYIPPAQTMSVYKSLFTFLEDLIFEKALDFLILGDFNIDQSNQNLKSIFENFCYIVGAKQFNSILNCLDRTIDLVICNLPCMVTRCAEPFIKDKEDPFHPTLEIELSLINSFKTCPLNANSYYNFKKANFFGLYSTLREIDWNCLDNVSNVEQAVDIFYENLYTTIDTFVPKSVNKKNKYPPWFTPEIILDIRAKKRNHRLYKKTKLLQCLTDFKFLRTKIKKDIKVAYRGYIQNVERNMQRDPKEFWNFIKSKKKNSNDIHSEMILGNDMFTGGLNISNAFAQHFESVYQPPLNQTRTQYTDIMNFESPLALPTISVQSVCEAISKLKNKKSVGPDKIPRYLLKGCKEVLSEPLAKIFNLAITSKKFPKQFKTARISPIYKSGSKNNIENYRPIAILSSISIVFESILYDVIIKHVEPKLSDFQFGFRKNRSVAGDLLDFVTYSTDVLAKGNQIDTIYTDFAKAFDKVDHNILVHKLTSFSISLDFCQLIKSYLSNRNQYVSVNNYQSNTYIASSGVPQGSSLGPLLFLLFINDITSTIKSCKVLLFADDMKVYKEIKNINDCFALQNELDGIYNWSKENNLLFNIKKCKQMSYTYSKKPIEFKYTMNYKELETVTSTKDLGIIFDKRLTFNDHVNYIISASCKKLGFF